MKKQPDPEPPHEGELVAPSMLESIICERQPGDEETWVPVVDAP